MQSSLAKRSVAGSKCAIDPKLGDLLQQLRLQEHADAPDNPHIPDRSSYMDLGTDDWIQTELQWALDEAADSAVSLPYLEDDEGSDACSPHIYDPTFFSPPQSKPSSPSRRSVKLYEPNDEKPLPEVPRSPRYHPQRSPPPPPPSPRSPRIFANSPLSLTPPVSPQLAQFPSPPASPPLSPQARTFPRSRPPSTSTVSTASLRNTPPRAAPTHRHATYPSISSTLDLLGDRETETEKRAGVYVDPTEPSVVEKVATPTSSVRSRSGSVLTGSGSVGRSSFDTPRQSMAVTPGSSYTHPPPVRKQRPALPTLMTSTSSPQLRAQYMSTSSSASTVTLIPPRPSLSSLSNGSSATVPRPRAATACVPSTCARPALNIEEEDEPQLASRWSLDSIASRPAPSSYTPPAVADANASTSGAQPNKGRKRDRLMSLISISRGRSGSLGKAPAATAAPSARPSIDARRSTSKEPLFEMVVPPGISASSSVSSSVSSLITPADSPRTPSSDPFSPTSESFFPDEHDMGSSKNTSFVDMTVDERSTPPPEPTLPLPSPGTPTASFLFPTRPPSLFSALKRTKRRARKLVISGAPLSEGVETAAFSKAHLSDLDLAHRKAEQKRRYENAIKWCENFGPLRKVERKDDGSLHVYWKDREVADTVCRLHAQVYIEGVGRVSLAWHYIN